MGNAEDARDSYLYEYPCAGSYTTQYECNLDQRCSWDYYNDVCEQTARRRGGSFAGDSDTLAGGFIANAEDARDTYLNEYPCAGSYTTSYECNLDQRCSWDYYNDVCVQTARRRGGSFAGDSDTLAGGFIAN